jgi:gas vesicle protein GvpN
MAHHPSTDAEVPSISKARVRNDGDAFIPEPSDSFVETDEIADVCERAIAYLEAGYPVHLAGASGIGKTTLAFHLAAKLGQPAVLIHGNHEFGSSDLVGGNVGYKRSKVVDNYIHSVLKTSEEMKQMWVDNRLAKACREGYTLIYDEFNRSKAEANNILLSVFEEKILSIPDSGKGYIRVHPTFRAILTSNPDEYAGTQQTQDALLDRLITIKLRSHDPEAELAIAMERSQIDVARARVVVDVVRHIRALDPTNTWPSVRSTVAICKVLARTDRPVKATDPFFARVCEDILLSGAAATASREEYDQLRASLNGILKKVCG